jgi:2-phospho-L-lactate guanylyltransferase
LVLPADIPLITPEDVNQIVKLADKKPSIVISPSRNNGTNALLQKPPNLINPCFGPNSFSKHKTQASQRKIPTKIYKSEKVTLDIDSPKDIEKLLEIKAQTMSHKFLEQMGAKRRLKKLTIEYRL